MVVVHAFALVWLLTVLAVAAIVLHECRRDRRMEAKRKAEDREVAALEQIPVPGPWELAS